MAFSPFNVFRRNQKAIFAVITVFIMFTFVLSSGLGGGADFFDWFPRWLGGAGKRGSDYCSIDGDRVYDRDIREVRFNRVMANRFMLYAAQQTAAVLRRDAQEKLVEATPLLGNPAREVLEGKQSPGFQVMAQMMANAPNARQQDKALVAVIQMWQDVDRHKQIAETQGGTYFLNAPNKTVRDVVDFMLWERKADKFGISFTEDDVKKLVRQEFFDQFKSDVEIREIMSREYSGRFTPNALFKALSAEFKVRAAQTALLGPVSESAERTATAAPIFTTPFDLFSYYKDKTSPATYQALAVPAASFATLVKDEPKDSDVQRLFNERKDYEPDPTGELPGFKEPRKVKVEWVSATGDEPYYKKAATDWIARTELFSKGGVATLTVPAPGVGPASWVGTATAAMRADEPLLHAMYKELADAHTKQDLVFRWGGPFGAAGSVLPSQMLSSSWAPWTKRADRTKDDIDKKRPVYAAGPELAAELTALGTASIGGSSLLQPAAVYAQAVAHEMRDRGTSGGILFLATVPGPGMLPHVVGAEAAFRQTLPKAVPLEAVRSELQGKLADRKARDLAVADLRKLQAELTKLGENGKARNTAAAKAFAAEFVKERGLRTDATPEAVSEWTVREDPHLAPLRDTQKGTAIDPQTGLLVPFGQRFFTTLDEKKKARVTAAGLYLPEFHPERAADLAASNREPVFLAWRTDDQPSKSLTLAQARPRVLEAWRRARGREEAARVADQLAARLKGVSGSSPAQFVPAMYDIQAELQGKFADQAAKDRVKLFKLENVAPIQILNELTGMARPFTLVGSPDIQYPSPAMEKKLLDERAGPAKTVFVSPDAPKDTYYVFALTGRQERGVEEFRNHLYAQAGRGPIRELVLAGHAREAVTRARDSVVALLRKEFNYEESDAQRTRLEERDKKGEE